MVFGRRERPEGETPLLVMSDDERGELRVGYDETVVLLGASGCGKTTILRQLVGVGPPLRSIELEGRKFSREQVAATIGWVPQNDGVFLSESVWQNVQAPQYVKPCSKEAAADALDWVGLADRAGEPVVHLGWAARRRVAFARAIARRKPLMIVDGELDRTLWPMFPALCSQFDWLHGVLVANCTAEDLAWSAESVAPVEDGRVLTQAPLADLIDSTDPGVKGVLAWTTP